MKTLKSLCFSMVTVAGLAALSVIPAQSAQAAASASATASADIINQIAIEQIAGTNLVFGQIIPLAGGGTVIVAPDSSRTNSTGVEVVPSSPHTAAGFRVTGNGNNTFAISLPSAPITITNGAGGATMTVTAFTSNPAATGQLVAGTKDIYVGGTLNVAGNQEVGHYTGSFSVTVAYN